MKVSDSIWDKLTRVIVLLLVVAAVLGVFVWYEPVVQENQRMRQEQLALETKIGQETETGRMLDTQLRSFQNPTLERSMVERLARERLSYAKQGENVIHFETAPASLR